jgi:hypothetical protein
MTLIVLGTALVWTEDRVTDPLRVVTPPRSVDGRRVPTADPFDLVSSTSLLHFLEDLTEIEPHSGWRLCGSAGERQALAYIEHRLGQLEFLVGHGLEVERQHFRTIAGVEIHQARLELEIDSTEREVPADAISGHPYNLAYTRLYDSDGGLTDLVKNPVVAEGPASVFTSPAEIRALAPGELAGRIAVLDFALIDRVLVGTTEALNRLQPIFEASAAGLVAVTSDSLTVGESHGSFALDSSVLSYIQQDPPIPVLVARIEDMAAAGIHTWEDLEAISNARLTWDTDIVSPGESGNIIARLPGMDSSRATILSAHLDSPNCPGALDNGSGSTSLLEVARVLDRSRTVPPVDVYLVWFGCHEKGVFGSAHFAATNQELLDRTLGMIELDAMARPLNGLDDPVNLESWSYARLGDNTLPFPDFLQDEVGDRNIDVLTWDFHWLLSDITGFVPYDVPNALLDNLDMPAIDELGSAHYIAHWHTPNDRIEHARAEAEQFEQLTRVVLSAALDTGDVQPNLRVTPLPTGRAVFVGSHTEAVHMAPFLFTDLGTILASEGLDVDLMPYGEPLTTADLEEADLVVVLPVHDYPNEYANANLYDEEWSDAEISVLVGYVENGGLLVLTNSATRLGPFARPRESNEDWGDVNAVADEFGVEYLAPIESSEAVVVGEHALVDGVDTLAMIAGNGVALSAVGDDDLALAQADGALVAVLVAHGEAGGEIVALGDVGMLVSQGGEPSNFRFWQNLAQYAASR